MPFKKILGSYMNHLCYIVTFSCKDVGDKQTLLQATYALQKSGVYYYCQKGEGGYQATPSMLHHTTSQIASLDLITSIDIF